MKKLLHLLLLISFLPIYAQYQSVWDQVPESVRSRNSFKRYEWYYRNRLDEQGKYPKEFIQSQRDIEASRIELSKILNKGTTVSDTWTNIGPVGIDMSSSFIPYWGTVSGRIRGLDVHPTDANTVYIGAASGGIWKTTDGGTTWTDKSSTLNHLTFGSIAIDPGTPTTIYAGTGESMAGYNNTNFEGDGLYKSTDGGNNWTQQTGVGTQTQIADIEVSPTNSNIVLCAVASGNWNLGSPSNIGIWRTSNGGTNWTRVISVDRGFDVSFHPTDPNLAYCTIGNQNASGGFFISTNAGVNWTQSNTGLPAATSIQRMQFELSLSTPATIYSVIYNNSALPGGQTTAAFKSTNGGTNWSQISSGVLMSGAYDGVNANDQGWYDLCISVNPTDANNVMFGNTEVSKTTDGSNISFLRNPAGYHGGVGAWAQYTHVDIHKIMFAPSNSSIVYIGCDGGIYKSTNSGSTFSYINNNINTIQFYRVASHPTNSSILYGGAQDNGNFSTTDKGATNWVFESSGDGMECFVNYNDPNYVFMSTQQGSLQRSTDAGANWSTVKSSNANITAWTAPYWQHPTNPTKIYAAVELQIYRSITTGSSGSFSAISPSLGNVITSVTQSAVNTSNMMLLLSYYTTSPSVYKSTDEGVTWTSITANITGAGFTGTVMQRVIADPLSANTFYITRASYGIGQVIRTTDFGTTWTDISSNLPKVTTNDIFVDPSNGSHIFAANDFGVYWSSNSGGSWAKLSNGMPFVPVLDFDFYNSGGTRYLRAASHGRGVFELNIDSPLPVELLTFTAQTKEEQINLNWSTATEINNSGFEIERSVDRGDYKKIGFVQGSGNSNVHKDYAYIDKYVNGLLSYRLKQIDNSGSYTYSNPVEVKAFNVNDFAVFQNYPNPFNPITIIKFKVPETSNIQVTITNALGEKIETLVNEQKASGIYEYSWDGSKYSSGVYFYTVNMNSISGGSKGFNKTYKMILTK